MSYTARHAGKVSDNGVLVFADPSAWRAAVARHHGHEVWVTITRQQHLRTMSQSRYYWGVVLRDVADYCGESREAVHEYLKGLHLPKRSVELLDGRRIEMPGTTTTLTVEEFSQYVESCRAWAATFLGLSIPDANQVEETL